MECELDIVPIDIRLMELQRMETNKILRHSDDCPTKKLLLQAQDAPSNRLTPCSSLLRLHKRLDRSLQSSYGDYSLEALPAFTVPATNNLPVIAVSNLDLKIGRAGSRTQEQVNAGRIVIEYQLDAAKDSTIAFTDGSALGNPGPTGSGAVIHMRGLQSTPIKLAKAVHSNSNSFEGELHAIEMATKLISEKPSTNRPIHIFSDCQSAIQAVVSPVIQNNYHLVISKIHNNIKQIQTANSNTININWVPGHCNINQNEEADRLAKTGANLAGKVNKQKVITINEAKAHNKSLSSTIWKDRRSSTSDSNPYTGLSPRTPTKATSSRS